MIISTIRKLICVLEDLRGILPPFFGMGIHFIAVFTSTTALEVRKSGWSENVIVWVPISIDRLSNM